MRSMMVRGGVAAATVAAMVLSVGCGGGDPVVSACTPGQTTSCACAGGQSGVQTCQAGGAYAACSCTQADAGGGADAPDVMSVDVVDAGPSAVDAPLPDAPMDAGIDVPPAVDVPPGCPGSQMLCSGRCASLPTDPMNCGACGAACALPGVAIHACVGGSCVIGACTAGSADCDGTVSNGCEIAVRGSDVNNCGGCGVRCAFANAAATCAGGTCALGACTPGFADCDDVAANGCEVHISADISNCGACSTPSAPRACSSGQVCSAGVCAATCRAGLTVCSGQCASLPTDPMNCGACGTVCPPRMNAAPACAGSMCGFVCNAGFRDCDGNPLNGCETNITTASNCGACGVACGAAANAAPSCAAGACGLTCNTGFANCDGSAGNGCEVNTTSSNAHCGACGNACAVGSRCVAGVCGPDACGAPASTLCGSDLLTGWVRPSGATSCTPPFVARDFSSVAATSALSSCGAAVDLVAAGVYAERPFSAVVSRCSSPTPLTITMVGRLATNYQRSLGFKLRWASGESVTLNRWVWNSPEESAADVVVSTSSGTLVNYSSSSANTGSARSDRPWGWYIGNDAGWWRMTVTVDPAADTISATFTQPSQGSTVYTATYSTPIPDDSLPSLTLIPAGPCAGGGLSSQLLSLTANPPLWQ